MCELLLKNHLFFLIGVHLMQGWRILAYDKGTGTVSENIIEVANVFCLPKFSNPIFGFVFITILDVGVLIYF